MIVLMYLIISAWGPASDEGEAQFPIGTLSSPRATGDKGTCLPTTHATLSSTDFKSVPPCLAEGGGNCPLIYNRLPFIPKSCLIKNQSRRPITVPITAYRSVIGCRRHRRRSCHGGERRWGCHDDRELVGEPTCAPC